MKIDFRETDGLVQLAADKRRGIWGSQLLIRGTRTVRTAGQLPTTASAHSLLTVALLNSLNSISRGQAAKLAPIGRMRLIVLSSDAQFVNGLNMLVQNVDASTLRSGKNFLDILAKKIERFDVKAMLPDANDKGVLILGNWLSVNALHPASFGDLPVSIAPNIISQIL
jgi:hypothetical protein